jgi:hypothetical protein
MGGIFTVTGDWCWDEWEVDRGDAVRLEAVPFPVSP